MALPENYEPSERGGLFTKIQQGANRLRFVGQILTGFVYWNTDNKPVRLAAYPEDMPSDIRPDKNGNMVIKDMWAGLVYNYQTKKVEIFEPTQATIHNALYTLEKNDEWGDLLEYDVTITRKGEGLETEYTVTPSPKAELSEGAKKAVADNKLELEPFKGEKASSEPVSEDDVAF